MLIWKWQIGKYAHDNGYYIYGDIYIETLKRKAFIWNSVLNIINVFTVTFNQFNVYLTHWND